MENKKKEVATDEKMMGLREGGRGRSGSSAGVLEMWKRKRELGVGGEGEEGREGGEGFQKSKKTARSPVGGGEMEMMGAMKRWMEEMMGRWERLEERLEGRMEEKMKLIIGELEGLKRREEEWKREREEMGKRVEELERKWEEGLRIEERGEELGEIRQRVEKLERNGSGRGKEEGEDRGLEERVRKMEERWEWRERKERRRRVVIKGYKLGGKEVRSKVEDILKKIGAEVGVEEVREVKTGREEQGGFAVVSFRTEGEKREVMRKKGGLRGEGVWIEDDLTWKERQVRWRIREVAKEEESKGAKVWVGENRVMINGVWWFWDEEVDGLKDRGGRKWGDKRGVRMETGEEERKG